MSILRTYRNALVALAVALALALACVGLAPASAWASVAAGSLGINVEVPSTIEQRPGVGDPGDGGKRPGSTAVLGVNVQVPAPTQTSPGESGNTGAQTTGAGAVLGINLSVPPTVEQVGGDEGSRGGASAVLGVNLSVPDPAAPDPEDPDAPGLITGDKASGASAVLGINLNVPSTLDQAPGEDGRASGSEAVLGVNLKVPEGEMVTFYGNGGRGTETVPVIAGHEISRPDDAKFFWPGRHIVGWYVDPSCTGDAVEFPLTDEVLQGHKRFYAKWAVDDPRAIGGVELHLVESADNGGNETTIEPDELSSHGVVGDGGTPDGYVEAGADELGGPVYDGRYYPGGDGTVWPLPEDANAADREREGATLELPTPEMADSADGMRSGWFDGWYRTCEPVVDAAGEPVLDDAGHPTYRYDDPVQKVGDRWVLDKFDVGAGADGDPAYQQVLYAKWRTGQRHWFTFDANGGAWADGDTAKPVKVQSGDTVAADAVPAPEREGYTFHSWRANSPGGPVWSFSTRVTRDMTVYAEWARNEYTVSFDAAGGSAVAPRKVAHGDVVAEPTTTRPGYTFEGWYLDADGDGAIGEDEALYDFALPVTGPLSLIAQWAEETIVPMPDYTVEFVVGDGVDPVPSQTVKGGRPARKPDPDPVRAGYTFAGWWTSLGEGGQEWDFLTPVTEAAVSEDGVLTLYAKWHAPEELTVVFDAGKGAFEGAGDAGADVRELTVTVMEGDLLAAPDPAPKRAGWQFAGWHAAAEPVEGWDEDGTSVVPLGDPWDFDASVDAGMTLHAAWTLRLDVTVPVSVAFAVDATTGEATGPDAGRYALKSRTVRPVSVDALALASEQAELEGIFALGEGVTDWHGALAETRLSLAPGGAGAAAGAVTLPFADDGASGPAWSSVRELAEAERAAWTLGAFDYVTSGASFAGDAWTGGDPSVHLPLALGLEVSDRFEVLTGQAGPVPVTHLKLTVSARW